MDARSQPISALDGIEAFRRASRRGLGAFGRLIAWVRRPRRSFYEKSLNSFPPPRILRREERLRGLSENPVFHAVANKPGVDVFFFMSLFAPMRIRPAARPSLKFRLLGIPEPFARGLLESPMTAAEIVCGRWGVACNAAKLARLDKLLVAYAVLPPLLVIGYRAWAPWVDPKVEPLFWTAPIVAAFCYGARRFTAPIMLAAICLICTQGAKRVSLSSTASILERARLRVEIPGALLSIYLAPGFLLSAPFGLLFWDLENHRAYTGVIPAIALAFVMGFLGGAAARLMQERNYRRSVESVQTVLSWIRDNPPE